MPTFNRARFVTEAIDSVRAQSFPGWELVVVDDGGTDDTAQALARFSGDQRIRVIRQENAGSAIARNRGIAETRGALIAYLDDDNLWYPDFLARAVDCLATEPEVDVVYGALVTELHELSKECILWRPFDRNALLEGNFIDTNVLVHRRALLEKYGGWDEAVARVADWDLVLRFTADKPAKPIAVLGAYYRECDDKRLSRVLGDDDSLVTVRRRWI